MNSLAFGVKIRYLKNVDKRIVMLFKLSFFMLNFLLLLPLLISWSGWVLS